MSLIDADILDFSKVFIGNSKIAKDCRCGAQAYIDIQPRVDAVEVVRCKECKLRYTTRCGLYYGTTNFNDFFLTHGEDFYCAYGERKEVTP